MPAAWIRPEGRRSDKRVRGDRSRLQTTDGAMADVVRPADAHQGFPGFPPRNGFLALVVRQFRLAAHDYPASFGALPAFRVGTVAHSCRRRAAGSCDN